MTNYTQPTKDTETYAQPSRSDFVSGSTAKFGTAKFNLSRFGKDSDFQYYSKLTKSGSTTYALPTKN